MTKTLLIVLLALIWALVLAKTTGGGETLACYEEVPQKSISEVKELVLSMVEEAGFDFTRISRIVECESGWKTDVHNWNDPNGGSHGLWQLNGVHNIPLEEMINPYLSTLHAIELLKSPRSYKHWACDNVL